MFTNFIWDFDGTLFDTYPHINRALLETLKGFGIEASPEETMALLKVSFGEAIRHYTEKYRISGSWEPFSLLQDRYVMENSQPFPEILALCRELFAKGGRHFLYTHRDRLAWTVLEDRGCKGLFTGGVTEEDQFPHKPAPDAILSILKQWEIPAETAVMIGDRPIDALSGRNAGITGVLWDEDGRFPEYQEAPKVRTVEELREFLLQR